MDAKNGYCSAQLKKAKDMVRVGYYDAAINAIGKGIEHLLEELFDELRDHDKNNLIELSVEYEKATRKKDSYIWKNGIKKLKLRRLVDFYQDEKVFSKLEQTFDYEFEEFNRENLHKIRCARNEYGSHENEDYDSHRKLSNPLIDLYSKILLETGRVAPPSSIVLSNMMQTADTQELQLLPNEKYELKRNYDDILQIEPNNIDILFLRAFLLRGEESAHDDLEKILRLNPNHSEARKERIWNLNHRVPEEQTPPHPPQGNNLFQNIFQTISARIKSVEIFSRNIITINFDISEKAMRYMGVIVLLGLVIIVVGALGLGVISLVYAIILEIGKFADTSLTTLAPYIPLIIVAAVVAILGLGIFLIARVTRKKSPWDRFKVWVKNLSPW